MTDTFRAVYSIIDPNKRLHSFEVNFFKFIQIDFWI